MIVKIIKFYGEKKYFVIWEKSHKMGVPVPSKKTVREEFQDRIIEKIDYKTIIKIKDEYLDKNRFFRYCKTNDGKIFRVLCSPFDEVEYIDENYKDALDFFKKIKNIKSLKEYLSYKDLIFTSRIDFFKDTFLPFATPFLSFFYQMSDMYYSNRHKHSYIFSQYIKNNNNKDFLKLFENLYKTSTDLKINFVSDINFNIKIIQRQDKIYLKLSHRMPVYDIVNFLKKSDFMSFLDEDSYVIFANTQDLSHRFNQEYYIFVKNNFFILKFGDFKKIKEIINKTKNNKRLIKKLLNIYKDDVLRVANETLNRFDEIQDSNGR